GSCYDDRVLQRRLGSCDVPGGGHDDERRARTHTQPSAELDERLRGGGVGLLRDPRTRVSTKCPAPITTASAEARRSAMTNRSAGSPRLIRAEDFAGPGMAAIPSRDETKFA
ncbi:MAG: hypothetical protein ACRDG9_06455, partial [Actinomycetota bacterium]